jgi:hypothetical protein
MRYVQRDKSGKVIGHYSNPQDYAQECVPDDHPDIADYNARRKAARNTPTEVRVTSTVIKSPWPRGVTRLLAKQFGVSEQEMMQMIKDEAKEPYLGIPGMGGVDAWRLEGYEVE